MRLNLEKIQALVPSGKVDESIFKSIVAQVKASGQSLVFDSDLISDATIKGLAVEIATEHPDVRVTDEEVNMMKLAERIRGWFVWKDGRRLSPTHFNINRDRIVEALQQRSDELKTAPTPDDVDLVVNWLDAKSQLLWEKVAQAPAPAPAAPPLPPAPPVVRTLPNGEPELPIDSTQSEMERASVEQLRDLTVRQQAARQPNRQFRVVTQGGGHQLMGQVHAFEPLPVEISKKAILNASLNVLKSWRNRFGQDALDARLQGRG
jgi:hypothetical protein